MGRAWVLALAVSGCGGFNAVDVTDMSPAPDLLMSPFTTVQGLPEGETLTTVWGSDADHVFAVGSNAVRYLYYDARWHRLDGETGRDYFGLWGFSATNLYVCGQVVGDDSGIVVHFDGTAWVDEYKAPTALFGLWSDGTVLVAVGAQGIMYGKHLGTTTWQAVQTVPANPDVPGDSDAPILWGMSGNQFGDFAMAGDRDRVFHQEGMSGIVWLDPTVDDTIAFRSVWAPPGTSNNFFFGTNYLGVAWLTADPPMGLTDMVADQMYTVYRDSSVMGGEALFTHGIWGDNAKVLFVGDLGRISMYDSGANKFSSLISPASGALWGVWGSSPDDVWIVGEREVILHGKMP
jgi:hypothetical protein